MLRLALQLWETTPRPAQRRLTGKRLFSPIIDVVNVKVCDFTNPSGRGAPHAPPKRRNRGVSY